MSTHAISFWIRTASSTSPPLTVKIHDDRAFITHAGIHYEYVHNNLARGHKPIGWSLFSPLEYNLHCQAHACSTGSQYFIDARHPTITHGSHIRFMLHTREIVQTSGGGYRPEARVKHVEFRATQGQQD